MWRGNNSTPQTRELTMKKLKFALIVTLMTVSLSATAGGSRKVPPAQEMEQSVIVMMLNWLNLS